MAETAPRHSPIPPPEARRLEEPGTTSEQTQPKAHSILYECSAVKGEEGEGRH